MFQREQYTNARKDREGKRDWTLRKNQKKMLEIKNTVTEMMNVFDGFIKKRIS